MPFSRKISETLIDWLRRPPGLSRRSRTSPFNETSPDSRSSKASARSFVVLSLKLVIRMYPYPGFKIKDLTLSIGIISRTSLKSIGSENPSRIIVITTVVPFRPLIFFTASQSIISLLVSPSTLIILSPAFIPALYAGVPSIGEITVRIPFCIVITIPIPPNSPWVSICNSSKASGGSNEECGSRL